jgi:hypothetical protein
MPANNFIAGMARSYNKPMQKPRVFPAAFAFLRQSQC